MAKDADLSVKINDKAFEGDDLISIIKNSGIADNQVSKIEIISGDFTFSGFNAKNYEIYQSSILHQDALTERLLQTSSVIHSHLL